MNDNANIAPGRRITFFPPPTSMRYCTGNSDPIDEVRRSELLSNVRAAQAEVASYCDREDDVFEDENGEVQEQASVNQPCLGGLSSSSTTDAVVEHYSALATHADQAQDVLEQLHAQENIAGPSGIVRTEPVIQSVARLPAVRPVLDLGLPGDGHPTYTGQMSEREQRAHARERRQSVAGGIPLPPPLPPASIHRGQVGRGAEAVAQSAPEPQAAAAPQVLAPEGPSRPPAPPAFRQQEQRQWRVPTEQDEYEFRYPDRYRAANHQADVEPRAAPPPARFPDENARPGSAFSYSDLGIPPGFHYRPDPGRATPLERLPEYVQPRHRREKEGRRKKKNRRKFDSSDSESSDSDSDSDYDTADQGLTWSTAGRDPGGARSSAPLFTGPVSWQSFCSWRDKLMGWRAVNGCKVDGRPQSVSNVAGWEEIPRALTNHPALTKHCRSLQSAMMRKYQTSHPTDAMMDKLVAHLGKYCRDMDGGSVTNFDNCSLKDGEDPLTFSVRLQEIASGLRGIRYQLQSTLVEQYMKGLASSSKNQDLLTVVQQYMQTRDEKHWSLEKAAQKAFHCYQARGTLAKASAVTERRSSTHAPEKRPEPTRPPARYDARYSAGYRPERKVLVTQQEEEYECSASEPVADWTEQDEAAACSTYVAPPSRPQVANPPARNPNPTPNAVPPLEKPFPRPAHIPQDECRYCGIRDDHNENQCWVQYPELAPAHWRPDKPHLVTIWSYNRRLRNLPNPPPLVGNPREARMNQGSGGNQQPSGGGGNPDQKRYAVAASLCQPESEDAGDASAAATAATCRTRQPRSFEQFATPIAAVPAPTPVPAKAIAATAQIGVPVHTNLVLSVQAPGKQAVRPMTIPLSSLLPCDSLLQAEPDLFPTAPAAAAVAASSSSSAAVPAAREYYPRRMAPARRAAVPYRRFSFSQAVVPQQEPLAGAVPCPQLMVAAATERNQEDAELLTPCAQPEAQASQVCEHKYHGGSVKDGSEEDGGTFVPMEEVKAFLSAKPALVYHHQSDLANSFSVELDGRVTIPTLVLRDTAANCCVVSEEFLRSIGYVDWEPRVGCSVATSMGGTGYPIGRIPAGKMKAVLRKGTPFEMRTSPEFLVVKGRTIYDVLMGINDMRVMIGEVLLWEGLYRYYPDFASHGELSWFGEVPITSAEAVMPVLMTRFSSNAESLSSWLSCATAVQDYGQAAAEQVRSDLAELQLEAAAPAEVSSAAECEPAAEQQEEAAGEEQICGAEELAAEYEAAAAEEFEEAAEDQPVLKVEPASEVAYGVQQDITATMSVSDPVQRSSSRGYQSDQQRGEELSDQQQQSDQLERGDSRSRSRSRSPYYSNQRRQRSRERSPFRSTSSEERTRSRTPSRRRSPNAKPLPPGRRRLRERR